jgi:SAM-dependent methyltransferase
MSSLERTSQRYGEHHRTSRTKEFIFAGDERPELFRRYVGGPGKHVLDLGCRYGALTQAYLSGNDVVGLDIDRDALEEAAKLGIDTCWADAEEPLPFESASFDVVVCGELLEHLRDPDGVVAEIRRVLRRGGTLVGSVPNSFRLKNRLRFLFGRQPENDPMLLHLFSPDRLRALLRDFDDVRLEFIAGRFVLIHDRLMANCTVFRARKPGLPPPYAVPNR